MKRYLLTVLIVTAALTQIGAADKVFEVKQPDFRLSPYTGMTRQHWLEADRYLLEGAFSHIHSLDDPMYFQRLGEVCYPKDESNAARVRGATLEGMARTLFMAATLIREDSNVTINHIRLADYYRRQLTLLVDPTSKQFVGHRGKRGPCQDLVEFGALAISLFVCGDVVWDPLPQCTRDSLYAMIESYADGPTIDQNWRFFNVFPMSFFKSKGYPINDALLEKYVRLLLADYRGDGWYLDKPNYDYYSMWAYQLYGKLWSRFFGQQHYPELAARFDQNYREMFSSYPYLFGRDGKMPMWGRSNMYRFAAAAPLAWGTGVNQGWMRRIASGCLLQFLQHPDFLYTDGIPTPGWYGLFDPVLQGYSCRGSVYWCAKAFLPLLLPADSEYWRAVENEGPWAAMQPEQVCNHWFDGPEMLITNYPSCGSTEVRAYCYSNTWEEFRGSEQYNRLAYNTDLPWMADGKAGEVAMAYVVKNGKGEWEALKKYTCKGFDGRTLTREAELKSDGRFKMTLKDTPLPNGTLREDAVTSLAGPTEIHLGHYALPETQGRIQERSLRLGKGRVAYLIYNGTYELALIPLEGWSEQPAFVRTTGLHPEAAHCETINLRATVTRPTTFKTLMLMKKGRFGKRELRR